MDYLGSTFRDSDLIALELYPKPKSTGSFFFYHSLLELGELEGNVRILEMRDFEVTLTSPLN